MLLFAWVFPTSPPPPPTTPRPTTAIRTGGWRGKKDRMGPKENERRCGLQRFKYIYSIFFRSDGFFFFFFFYAWRAPRKDFLEKTQMHTHIYTHTYIHTHTYTRTPLRGAVGTRWAAGSALRPPPPPRVSTLSPAADSAIRHAKKKSQPTPHRTTTRS